MANKRHPSPLLHLLLVVVVFLGCPPPSSGTTDTLSPGTNLTHPSTLVSASGVYELGFFALSRRYYLGIWFHNIPVLSPVWVANGAAPSLSGPPTLTLLPNASLLLLTDPSGSLLWSAASSPPANSARILDTGNFVLAPGPTWQSFDYITDTLLPGMQLRQVNPPGRDNYMRSWKSYDDPAPGEYVFKLDRQGSPQIFLRRGDGEKVYSSGTWNGRQFTGVPDETTIGIINYTFVTTPAGAFYSYQLRNGSLPSRLQLLPSGVINRYIWLGTDRAWSLFWSYPKDQCDSYALCGPYGVCNSNLSPVCNCLTGFRPASKAEWALRDFSGGCVREDGAWLGCPKNEDGFQLMTGMKLPDTSLAAVNGTMSLEECRQACLDNCSCNAYGASNVTTIGGGCFMWPGQLLDLRQFGSGGQDIYIRLPASLISNGTKGSTGNKSDTKRVIAIVFAAVFLLLLLGIGGFYIKRKRERDHEAHIKMEFFPSSAWRSNVVANDEEKGQRKDFDLPLIGSDTLAAATNNFASANKLGEGGFGPVYKGKLVDGVEIAVKRLAENSSQGQDEFKNEVKLIAKLQHRNLVRLLGYCIDGEERTLVYEFMPNRSLDTFIFDKDKCALLDWKKRQNIILGIARGLLYLHEDSRLRIIHRDLKASNILLDKEMRPKISDFGMARIFGGDQADAHTLRVVGTYGYMSPEYAMDGIFSVKSDVFSFGVLVLEIISGKKNKGVFQTDPQLNLLSYTWRLWKESKGYGLIDESMCGSCNVSEIENCILVGLLCVQEQAIDRPTMTEVIMMLSGKSVKLPEPSMPGFSIRSGSVGSESVSTFTRNNLSVTGPYCR